MTELSTVIALVVSCFAGTVTLPVGIVVDCLPSSSGSSVGVSEPIAPAWCSFAVVIVFNNHWAVVLIAMVAVTAPPVTDVDTVDLVH